MNKHYYANSLRKVSSFLNVYVWYDHFNEYKLEDIAHILEVMLHSSLEINSILRLDFYCREGEDKINPVQKNRKRDKDRWMIWKTVFSVKFLISLPGLDVISVL